MNEPGDTREKAILTAIEAALDDVMSPYGARSDVDWESVAEVAEKAVVAWEAERFPFLSLHSALGPPCGKQEPHEPHSWGGSCNDYFRCGGR